MVGASSSSGSSFTSSSLGRPSSYSRSFVSPADATWTPTSGYSTVSATSTGGSVGPEESLGTLDLGPPGYQATITLFQDTPDERTIYLGPWEVVGSEQRRVLWQCSYQNELLEHYLPSDTPSNIHPHTHHSRHRRYHEPSDMERYVTFQEPHRIRYTTDKGVCIHDDYVRVRYEFTSVDSSKQFQGDLRRRDMVDFYDIDVVWTNIHGRRPGFGSMKGIGVIQRLKMWQDRYTTCHSLSVLASKTDGQYREYEVHHFDREVQIVDEKEKQLQLNVRAPRRKSFTQRMRPRQRSTGSVSNTETSTSPPPIDIKYLAIQFTSRKDYKRFTEAWKQAHSADQGFQGGLPFPTTHFELPSPEIMADDHRVELATPDWHQSLDTVPEPADTDAG